RTRPAVMKTRLVAFAAALLASLTSFAQPPAFPTHAVTLIVPVAPGGILDTVARMIASDMSRSLGQPVVVDNKPGASGNIGAALVAKSAADGYTLLEGYSMFHVGNPSMFQNLTWDAQRDCATVAMGAVSQHGVAANSA